VSNEKEKKKGGKTPFVGKDYSSWNEIMRGGGQNP
jgi:hypothetical protein